MRLPNFSHGQSASPRKRELRWPTPFLRALIPDVDENAEEAWREEIRRRLQEIDSNAVDLIPWPDARKKLESRLKR
jgi:hypothetical protein